MINVGRVAELLNEDLKQISVDTGYQGDVSNQVVGSSVVSTIKLDESQGNGAIRTVNVLDSQGNPFVTGAITENKTATQSLTIRVTIGVSEV